MMKYVLLAYRDVTWWEALSALERAAFETACQVSEHDLRHRLHLLDVQNLEQTALTLKRVNDHLSLVDDPVSGNRVQLVQLFFIQARDLNGAIQLASQMPQMQGGPIEVRQLANPA